RLPAHGHCPGATCRSTRRSRSRFAGSSRSRSTSASSPTSSSWRPAATPTAIRRSGSSRPPICGSCRSASIPPSPPTPPCLPSDTAWHPVDDLPLMAFDHGVITLRARERLRAKLSYTNVGFALAPETFTVSELRLLYCAALGHSVSTTNLKRVLVRRRVL